MALSATERTALADLRRRLTARFGGRLARFTLFGSRARGEGHEESDLDVLVLVHQLTRQERRATIDDAGDVEMSVGLVLSPLVRDAETWDESTPLAREIARDGLSA